MAMHIGEAPVDRVVPNGQSLMIKALVDEA
jgi:hypothetical protein